MVASEPVFVFPAAVREQVLAQHRELRCLLESIVEETTRAFQRASELEELVRLAHDLRASFRAHLRFEERNLFPVLRRIDQWGPERVKALAEEHGRQRAQLDELVGGIDDNWDIERVAIALRSLSTDFLADMAEEERGCLDAELLKDQILGQ